MKETIRRMALEQQKTRREIAEELGISYMRVYRALKDVPDVPTAPNRGGAPIGSQSPPIEFEGQTLPRTLVVHELARRGHTVSEIAKLLGIKYQIVYSTLARVGLVKTNGRR